VGAKPRSVGMYFQTEDAFAMDELANMIVPAKAIGRFKGAKPSAQVMPVVAAHKPSGLPMMNEAC
ncbi:MAG: hypothetical protein VX210_07510, partial [Myxococcota bacterium]|nr:hypothetical protein [Myxococcota bacterium]